MSLRNFSQALRRSPRQNKIGHDLGLFSTSQKIVLSSSRGLSIFKDLQASRPRARTLLSRLRPRLQIVSSRPKTSLRTPPLLITVLHLNSSSLSAGSYCSVFKTRLAPHPFVLLQRDFPEDY